MNGLQYTHKIPIYGLKWTSLWINRAEKWNCQTNLGNSPPYSIQKNSVS